MAKTEQILAREEIYDLVHRARRLATNLDTLTPVFQTEMTAPQRASAVYIIRNIHQQIDADLSRVLSLTMKSTRAVDDA